VLLFTSAKGVERPGLIVHATVPERASRFAARLPPENSWVRPRPAGLRRGHAARYGHIGYDRRREDVSTRRAAVGRPVRSADARVASRVDAAPEVAACGAQVLGMAQTARFRVLGRRLPATRKPSRRSGARSGLSVAASRGGVPPSRSCSSQW
jgi:hypothetical protein